MLIEAGCLGTFLLGDLGLNVPLFFVCYALTFLGYILAIGTSESRSFCWMFFWGCVFRLTILSSTPSLSDDVYRYVWDGVVQLKGINPYLYAPASEALAGVNNPGLLASVNHAELPTIYPPFAQLYFRLCAWIAPGQWTIRFGICLWDCLTVVFLAGLARSYDLHPSVALVYFWNPLVIVEGAGQGHIDSVAVSLLVVALLYVRLHGYGRAAAALALSALTKLLPVLMLPAFWRWAAKAEADGKSTVSAMFSTRAILVPVVFTFVFAAGYLPFADAGWGVWGSLGTYATTWEFNAPLYSLMRYAGLGGEGSRWLLVGVLLASVVAISVSSMPPVQAAYYIVGIFLVLTPTLHPWYVVWIVPFLCFYGNRGWIATSGLIVLGYAVLIAYRESGDWSEPPWVVWGIVLGALLVWMWPRFGRR